MSKSIAEEIHLDADKQKLVQNIITYAKSKNIKIIAEGVETYEEMVKLIELAPITSKCFIWRDPALISSISHSKQRMS